MKFTTLQTAWGSATLLLAAQPCLATSQHRHHHHPLHKKHDPGHSKSAREAGNVQDRSAGTCAFPTAQGLVAVTPGSDNAGWALSPDQLCTLGSYCPYACPSGQVMAQWRDGSTYATTERMDGGLYCGLDGQWSKPFSNKPFCVDGTGVVKAVNTAGNVVSFCQTVLPGNEDIIIPNDVVDSLTLAVPDPTYWGGTSAHYYVNAPGVDSSKGCHWGDSSTPVGNWAPFVAGMNTDASGLTYVKLGRNPIWESSALVSTMPTFGLKIECEGNCVGLPCSVDGSGVTSNLAAIGAGGADFCIVTVPKGGSASIVIYNLDGSSGSTTTTKAVPTTSSAYPTSKTSTTSTIHTTSTTISTTSTSSKALSTSTSVHSSSTSFAKHTSTTASGYGLGGIFQENGTSSSSSSWAGPTKTAAPNATTDSSGGSSSSSSSSSSTEGAATASETPKNESSGPSHQGNAAIAGLIIALVAAGCIL